VFTLDLPTGQVRSLAFSSDSRFLATASGHGGVWVWGLSSRKVVESLDRTFGTVSWLTWAPGRNLLLLGAKAEVLAWDLDTGRLAALPELEEGSGQNLAYRITADALTVAYVEPGPGGSDFSKVTWNLATQEMQSSVTLDVKRPILSVALPSDGRGPLAFSDGKKSLTFLTRGGGAERLLLPGRLRSRVLQYAPDGRTLGIQGGRSVRLFDMPTRKVRATIQARVQINDITFTPDGKTLAGAVNDGVVKFWDVASGREKASYNWGLRQTFVVAFSPDGMTAAVGGDAARVTVWDVEAG
jgi:WD40 repeat protein